MRYLLFFCVCFSTQIIFSQSFTSNIGFRISNYIGASTQFHLNNGFVFEGIIQSNTNEAYTIALMLEKFVPIYKHDFPLDFYFGGGVHKGWELWRDTNIQRHPYGVCFVVGGMLTMGKFGVTLDYKPEYNFKGGHPSKKYYHQGGVTLRYLF